ncbi:MAG: signal peptidase II [Alphaproteobacteria bacterium]|nr:signal peptidase II [Alphaproteobacteria bacterium]
MNIPPPTRHFYLGLVLALVIFIADQASKFALVDLLVEKGNAGIDVLPFFKLVMVWNQGISFGMFSDSGEMRKYLLIGMALAITALMVGWMWRAQTRLLTTALAFVIGGAIGNVIDRFRWGAVADFFYFHHGEWFWPAFNIADSAIFIGVVLLCWESIVNPDKKST